MVQLPLRIRVYFRAKPKHTRALLDGVSPHVSGSGRAITNSPAAAASLYT